MRFSRIPFAILLVLCISVAPPVYASNLLPTPEGPLSPDDQKRIRDLASESAAASAKDNWQAARDALLKAWEIKPLPMLAANLGYAEVKLGLYREAAEHLKFFLDHAPADHPERRGDAEQQFAECHKHVAAVSIAANIDGAQVVMDSTNLGVTPLDKQFFLEPGTHSFRVTHAGYQPLERTILVEADKDEQLQFTLRHEPAFAPQPAHAVQATAVQPSPSQDSGIEPRTWALIGGSVATAVGLGFGIGYAIRAHSLNNDAESTLAQIDRLPDTTASQRAASATCRDRTGTAQALCEQLWSTRDKQTTATNVSNVAFITAGVLGVATVATYFLWPAKSSSAVHQPSAQLELVPWSDSRTAGLTLAGAFQ